MHISAYLSRDYMHAFSSLCTNIFYTLGALFDNTVSTMNEQIDLRNLVTTKHTKRIILLLDFIHKDHAMFRSYAETYRNYIDDPDCQMIIALAGIHLNQSEIKDLPDIFKDQIQLTRNDGESSFLQFIKAIKDFKADELIFPAFGFSHETAILSHMRLAPIQSVFSGHPVIPENKFIDRVYLNDANDYIDIDSRKKFKNKYFQFNQLDFSSYWENQTKFEAYMDFVQEIFLNFKSTIYRLGICLNFVMKNLDWN